MVRGLEKACGAVDVDGRVLEGVTDWEVEDMPFV
jgi:hypothetical protein